MRITLARFMRAIEIIRKKRDGCELTREEIAFIVHSYTRDEIPDYQVAAFLMAVFFRGMSAAETQALTEEIMRSGEVIDLSDLPGYKVDKHSTGGVGDKTSLVLAPLAAAAGVIVPMISGRGLAHTGGTLDKLESIPGFRVDLSIEEFRNTLRKSGLALAGQTNEITPADRKIYALRDVTATVDSIPLITASIMSKKLAEGIDGLILDVKVGNGAFMKTMDHACNLGETLVNTGQRMGKRVAALITDMNQPLGRCIGNSLEVIEAIETLKGRGPADLTELSVELAAYMLLLAQPSSEFDEARQKIRELIASGAGLEKFREVIELQGGNPGVIDFYSELPLARLRRAVGAPRDGCITQINTEQIGRAVMEMGGGRARVDSKIDHGVGIELCAKLGDWVKAGDPLCFIHAQTEEQEQAARLRILQAYCIDDSSPRLEPLVKAVIK